MESYAYNVSFAHNARETGLLVNTLINQYPQNKYEEYSLQHFDLYESCMDEGFLNIEKVKAKQLELLNDDTFPTFRYHCLCLQGPAGTGKSSFVKELVPFLGHAVYTCFTNVGTNNLNSKIKTEHGCNFGTLAKNMRLRNPQPTIEIEYDSPAKSFKEAQLRSLAADYYNLRSVRENIKKALPKFTKLNVQSNNNVAAWMLSGVMKNIYRDESSIPQIAFADAIVLDEAGQTCGYSLCSLAFCVWLIRTYMQINLDKTPVMILVGSMSQSQATKKIEDSSGTHKTVAAESMLDYIFKYKVVSDFVGIHEPDRVLIFTQNKRCQLKFLLPILKGLDLGKNVRSYAHLLDSIIVPHDVIANPGCEKKDKRAIEGPMVTEDNTINVDLSAHIRIALSHRECAEYIAACMKELPCIDVPVYVVVLINEIRHMSDSADLDEYIHKWLNDQHNDIGCYSQFKDYLYLPFKKVGTYTYLPDSFYPPVAMQNRPNPFLQPLTKEQIDEEQIYPKERIQLGLYRGMTRLLVNKPLVCQKNCYLVVTGFYGPLKRFIDIINNEGKIYSSIQFLLHLLKHALLYLECNMRFEKPIISDFEDQDLMKFCEVQEEHSYIAFLDIKNASWSQLIQARTKGISAVTKLYSMVLKTKPYLADEVVGFHVTDVLNGQQKFVLNNECVMNLRLNIGDHLQLLSTAEILNVPDNIHNKYYNQHAKIFPQMKNHSLIVKTDSGFVGALFWSESLCTVRNSVRKCQYKPLVSYINPVINELAMTIAKSQGLTLQKVAGIINNFSSIKSIYVLLSRASHDIVLNQNFLLNKNLSFVPNTVLYQLLASVKTRLVF